MIVFHPYLISVFHLLTLAFIFLYPMNWPILTLLLCIPIAIIFFFLKRQPKQKHIRFIGPRGTGKTATLHHLLGGKAVETVPSLEDNEIQQGNLTFHDIVPKKDEKGFNDAYGLNDKDARYFFFFNTENDLVDYERGYDVYFVHCGEWNGRFREGLKKRLITVKDKPEVLWNYIKME